MDDRISIQEIKADFASKYVPPHVNIFYCFGGLVFTSFGIQVGSGVGLSLYFVPEVGNSLSSVQALRSAGPDGWVIRSIHRSTASFNGINIGITCLQGVPHWRVQDAT